MLVSSKRNNGLPDPTIVFGETSTSLMTPSIGALTTTGSFAMTFTGAMVEMRTGTHSTAANPAAINQADGFFNVTDQLRFRFESAFHA